MQSSGRCHSYSVRITSLDLDELYFWRQCASQRVSCSNTTSLPVDSFVAPKRVLHIEIYESLLPKHCFDPTVIFFLPGYVPICSTRVGQRYSDFFSLLRHSCVSCSLSSDLLQQLCRLPCPLAPMMVSPIHRRIRRYAPKNVQPSVLIKDDRSLGFRPSSRVCEDRASQMGCNRVLLNRVDENSECAYA
jgi:hypothetical protein